MARECASCGKRFLADAYDVKRGKGRVCSYACCGRRNLRHGCSGVNKTPEYETWVAMRVRCLGAPELYPRYAGRGIRVCKRSDKFEAFLADMGPRPSLRHSLDRIDNNGNYTPGNCRWATPREQSNNTRLVRKYTVRGESLGISGWAHRLGLTEPQVRWRVKRYGIRGLEELACRTM